MTRHNILHFLRRHEDEFTAFAAVTSLVGLIALHALS